MQLWVGMLKFCGLLLNNRCEIIINIKESKCRKNIFFGTKKLFDFLLIHTKYWMIINLNISNNLLNNFKGIKMKNINTNLSLILIHLDI